MAIAMILKAEKMTNPRTKGSYWGAHKSCETGTLPSISRPTALWAGRGKQLVDSARLLRTSSGRSGLCNVYGAICYSLFGGLVA